MEKEIEDKIKKALDKIRLNLNADGGDVEFVSWDPKNGIVSVRFQGMCAGCPMAQMTLKNGIEKVIIEDVPEVKEVIAV